MVDSIKGLERILYFSEFLQVITEHLHVKGIHSDGRDFLIQERQVDSVHRCLQSLQEADPSLERTRNDRGSRVVGRTQQHHV
jgi:hypothetical protein